MVVSSLDYSKQFKQVALRNLNDQILFIGYTSEMAILYHMCDGVVLPTYYKSCSRIVLESIATNTRVITTSCDGASEFITTKALGYVIGLCGNIEALANVMLYFCDRNIESNTKKLLSTEAEGVVSISRCCNQLLALYQEILDEKQNVQIGVLK